MTASVVQREWDQMLKAGSDPAGGYRVVVDVRRFPWATRGEHARVQPNDDVFSGLQYDDLDVRVSMSIVGYCKQP